MEPEEAAQCSGGGGSVCCCVQPAALPSCSNPWCFPWPGYSEDGGALRGEVIPEHEFATGPVCLDDENEFPPVSIRDP